MATTDCRPVPIKNTAFRCVFPIVDADGDLVSGATGLDSEISKDQGTFVDCSAEAAELASASGMYYLDLTATEMNADCVAIIVKTTSSGAKTTALVFYPNETGDIDVDVTANSGTAAPTPDTAGYPKVTIKSGTGAGEVSVTSGVVSANTVQIFGSAEAAEKLSAGDISITLGTIVITGFTPTVTEFETDITEATTGHFVNGLVRWRSGALKGGQALCTAYTLTGGRGHFTVTSMTDAPANGDLLVIV